MRDAHLAFVLATAMLGAVACACNTRAFPAVELEVRPTLADTSLGTALGTIQDGAYLDSLRITDWRRGPSGAIEEIVLTAGWGMASGVYDITVSVPGFQVWDTVGVIVSREDCNKPQTVNLSVELQPF